MTDLPELNYDQLDRELAKTKTRVFLGKNASFLGSIMSSMDFFWDTKIETACTNGIFLKWNPYFFLSCNQKLRDTVLVHELWHPARLDMLRCDWRDPEWWNIAADISINNGLDDDGYSFEDFKPHMNHKYDGWVTEDIYDDITKNCTRVQFAQYQWVNPHSGIGDPTDMVQPGDSAKHTILNNVVSAVHQAKLSGAGNLPGDIELTLKKFLSPKIPWAKVLFAFFNEMANKDYSWSRPNRRYTHMYLPSLIDDVGGLDHIAYFLDVSGSITDEDIIRFHSEFKYVKETFEPEKMTMIQFDTKITKEDVFLKDDPFEETHVIGRGGTSLVPVREWIIKNKPTAVVIFSDLQCEIMERLPPDAKAPIIWIALNNRNATIYEGTLVHLKE